MTWITVAIGALISDFFSLNAQDQRGTEVYWERQVNPAPLVHQVLRVFESPVPFLSESAVTFFTWSIKVGDSTSNVLFHSNLELNFSQMGSNESIIGVDLTHMDEL